MECVGYRRPDRPVALVGVRELRCVAFVLGVAPNGAGDPFRRLPVVARMDVPMQMIQRVAKDLVVDAAQSVVATRRLDCFADQGKIEEELAAFFPAEVA